ncbi:MAG: hypothetical protein GOMPHAMPRED_000022 [Gomphillus americanus]|uniref:Uncharacterized protein n=1 Tax=Gomphillus americanus TaxID=1940652 RepID=A0A8H3I724_9LECA|nr:MAG: hypothetical protein GOMPHAMPRED_000022 [Gomphillus americanus]
MPPSSRRVSFSDRNHYSRLPREDEQYVMNAFAKHADNCDSCYDPYFTYKAGSTLCPKGHELALMVAEYVYTRGGQSFSQVDRERNQRVQIEIPANCEAVRLLLKAMDRGLRVMRRVPPPTSYDRSYYVPARLSLPDNQRSVPATRPLTTHSSLKPSKLSSSKASILETLIEPRQSRQSQVKSRSRSSSTSSISSAGSGGPRSSSLYFVRSRSKGGKRSHSPIFIRTGTSSSASQNNIKKEAHPVLSSSHARQGSTSSSSSRSSSVFSHSSSRNSSISSQSSLQGQPITSASGPAPAKAKVAFRSPEYQEPKYQTIAPKNSASSPVSPVRSRLRHSK